MQGIENKALEVHSFGYTYTVIVEYAVIVMGACGQMVNVGMCSTEVLSDAKLHDVLVAVTVTYSWLISLSSRALMLWHKGAPMSMVRRKAVLIVVVCVWSRTRSSWKAKAAVKM